MQSSCPNGRSCQRLRLLSVVLRAGARGAVRDGEVCVCERTLYSYVGQ